MFWSSLKTITKETFPTVRLGHDHSEVSDGAVGVAEPGAVKAEEDGGRRQFGRLLADMDAGRRGGRT